MYEVRVALTVNEDAILSNTVMIGYNEAAMCIEFYLENREPSPPRIRSGCAVRYIEDVVVYDRPDF